MPLELVWIEAGTFTMGTPEWDIRLMDNLGRLDLPSWPVQRYSWEFPAHEVTLTRGFYLGKYEVTQGQWAAVMGAALQPDSAVDADLPASGLSWLEVQAFLAKLNDAVGDTLYRLPTEAEWEYACRGGTTSLWHFTEYEIDQYGPSRLGEYEVTAEYTVEPVGRRLPNPWGLYDMGSNAAEWVLDGMRTYAATPQVDPLGPVPEEGEDKAGVRGRCYGEAREPTEVRWETRCGWRREIQAQEDRKIRLIGFRVFRQAGAVTRVEEASWGGVKKELPMRPSGGE